ncbi:hypothetical protein MTO96_006931 [Rhipicephalus appendiculatus]
MASRSRPVTRASPDGALRLGAFWTPNAYRAFFLAFFSSDVEGCPSKIVAPSHFMPLRTTARDCAPVEECNPTLGSRNTNWRRICLLEWTHNTSSAPPLSARKVFQHIPVFEWSSNGAKNELFHSPCHQY